MDSNKDYYNILGVKIDSTREEIKKVHGKLANLYHPDGAFPNEEKFIEVQEAWSVLSIPAQRTQYDALRAQHAAAQAAANQASKQQADTGAGQTTSSGAGNASQSGAPHQQRYKKDPRKRKKKTYQTSYSQTPPQGATGGTSGGGSTSGQTIFSRTAPQVSRNAVLNMWYRVTFYAAQAVLVSLQCVAGAILFLIAYGIVGPVVNFFFRGSDQEQWLTGTFLGLVVFSGLVYLVLRWGDKKMKRPRYRKVSYATGLALLAYFLVTVGIPNAASHYANGRVGDDVEVSESTEETVSVAEESTKSYIQNKQSLTFLQVEAIQRALAKDRSIYPDAYVTGTYGPLTHSAIIAFQKKYGLPAEGYFGPITESKIEEVFGVTIPAASGQTVSQSPAKSAAPTPLEYLTVRFVNQHGVSYGTYPGSKNSGTQSVYLEDTLGERLGGRFSWDAAQQALVFSEKIPQGEYVLYWKEGGTVYKTQPSTFGSPSIRRGHDAGSQRISYATGSTAPVVVTVPQTGTEYTLLALTMSVVNEVGTPIRDARVKVYDAVSGKSVGSVLSVGDKPYTHALYWKYTTLPGTYTLEITASSYQTKILQVTIPDLSYKSNAQIVAMQNVSVGNIVLVKE
jgi:peptidoglycan hydrolase-like protein with peptidoglycan-binding domain